MGLCGSKMLAEQRASRSIDDLVEKDAEKESQKVKLLLLGAGESGKSTIFKQFRILYGKGYTEDDRRNFKPVIFSNTLLSMKTLITQAEELGIEVAATADKEMIADIAHDAVIDAAAATAIKNLWADSGIQETYRNRARFQLNDSADYYFNKVMQISSASYLPSVDDVLRSRVRTSGIIEESYDINGVEFVVYDVGGQRNERKKWIHCFDKVTAVIFVASMSEYDQVLYEDSSVNRMEEAVGLFSEMCNSKYFEHSSMILFLNKMDLFETKIKTIDLRHEGGDGIPPRFLDYVGGCNSGPAREYIKNLFKTVARARDPEKLRIEYTCATDTNNVRVVFETCKEAILRDNVKGSGFMST